ncbi:MAG: hypothetical protein L0J35_05575 [Tetragenococcus halophilus]|nr:hypothetical protein [Tetragenococcus halophilus]
MTKLHVFSKKINDDFVVVNVYSEEVEDMANEVIGKMKNSFNPYNLSIVDRIEVLAREKARKEVLKYDEYSSPKYVKPLCKFYADLIKDEVLEKVF